MNTNENVNYEFRENIYNGENNNKRENILFGIVGAFFGSLVGVALWVILARIGFIAAISGFVMLVGALKGYEKLAGQITIKGVIATIIVMIIMVYVATYLSLGFEIYSECKTIYDLSLLDAMKSVNSFLEVAPEIKDGFIKNLLMGYGFTALGAFSTIKNMLSK